jgi:hypothetical protein
MLGLMDGKLGDHHSGELRRETAEQKANRIISEELLSLGWKESDLTTCNRSDRGKLASNSNLRFDSFLLSGLEITCFVSSKPPAWP